MGALLLGLGAVVLLLAVVMWIWWRRVGSQSDGRGTMGVCRKCGFFTDLPDTTEICEFCAEGGIRLERPRPPSPADVPATHTWSPVRAGKEKSKARAARAKKKR